ncbi:MAG: FAD-binding oxidoreductase [Balneolales bacterium]|nr:FAD-binding oxidoreductase [Balneolales bacterium]
MKIAIIGGGLAGSMAALSLARRKAEITLFHQNSSSPVGSMVPLALYNPAAALRAKKAWMAEACHESLHSVLDEFRDFWGNCDDIITENGVYRPALDLQMQEFFKESSQRDDWPEGWVSWIEPEEIKLRFPGVENRFGGLLVPVGLTICTPLFLEKIHTLLREKYGATILNEKVLRISETQDNVRISYLEKEQTADAAVLASGEGLEVLFSLYDGFPALKLHRVKGQCIEFKDDGSMPFEESLSARGYIAKCGEKAVAGSTYEHHFTDFKISGKARNELLDKIRKTLPGGFPESKEIHVLNQWSGVRLTTPDRKPLLGRLPGTSRQWITTGYGSKGLTYTPYCGNVLAANLLYNESIPFEVNLSRFLPPAEE